MKRRRFIRKIFGIASLAVTIPLIGEPKQKNIKKIETEDGDLLIDMDKMSKIYLIPKQEHIWTFKPEDWDMTEKPLLTWDGKHLKL